MLITVAKVGNKGFMCYNPDTRKLSEVTRLDINSNKVHVENLKSTGRLKTIIGEDKVPSYKTGDVKYTLVTYMTNNGKIMSGLLISNYCKSKIVTEQWLHDNRHLIVNYSYKNKVVDREIKIARYDNDDYHKLYKIYSSIGLATSNKINGGNYSSLMCFGDYVMESVSTQSTYEGFYESHKLVYKLLKNCEISHMVKIPMSFKLKDGQVVSMVDKYVYKVDFLLNEYRHKILIAEQDKRLLGLLKFKGATLNRLTMSDITDLVQYKDELDKDMSVYTVMDKSRKEKTEDSYLSDGTWTIGNGRLDNGSKTVSLRYNILFNNGDINILANKLTA